MDKEQFKHSTQVRVRNYEVDWQGIVHNANYLLYFELARFEYLKHLGIKVNYNTVRTKSPVVIVRNEINYHSSARFDELLTVYTRVSYIHNTSFTFEGMIEEARTKRLVADNIAVHVWLDPRTRLSAPVSDEFKRIIQKFEQANVAIAQKSLYT
jgi:acyl-CoA thioester hydrolase